jgi:hypothetical protein
MALRSIPRRLGRRVVQALHEQLPDFIAIQWRYRRLKGQWLNLRRPRTFDEKLHWLNLYLPDPRRAELADKYTARAYVAERLGPEVLNELYGVWDRAQDVPWHSLPNAFVLKVTAGCGWNIIRMLELPIEAKPRLYPPAAPARAASAGG